DGDFGLLQCGRGAQRRIEVRPLLQVHTAADAGGVDQTPQLPPELNDLVHRVAGGAGELVYDDAFFACCLVQERGLTDVRSSEDRNATWTADLVLRDRRNGGELLKHVVEQVGDATAVNRRGRIRLAESEAPESRDLRFLTS